MPPRFFVDTAIQADIEMPLPERVVRHAQVLRLAPGDAITLFDGRGGSHAATLLDMGKRHAVARVGSHDAGESELPFRVTLAQGLAGGDKMDWLIEKAVELGVSAVQPLQTARAVVRLNAERAEKRHAHWRALVEAACEQCGRNRLPHVAPATNLETWLAREGGAATEGGLRLLVSPRATESLVAVVERQRPGILAGGVTLLIGPEGGLAPDEEEAALRQGFTAVSLGPRILRTETAGLACLAALNALLGGF
ncbi:16S rRNA (uracil(1498)-N(3))-methyltransferase [Cupriavidus respiraculi]|uniref:Ribosomal RNA small subunit methyltransferase E n=1 Tax=Cupriavidus respiraculi TaxID=195930 RepID=A0ABN7YVE3_9BURK|nr:16S rRNA (uracil(1498)-N(3))-methyltransferase [Cupriavidus respiraculi]CAG9176834.1 Ribosomal RNA small subunit methyltransferase E [Cupriavidus respiraculi]